MPESLEESVLVELTEPLEEVVSPGLPVAAEGDFWELEVGHTVPLRVPDRLEDPLPDAETVCVTERDTTALLENVAAPELLFDIEAEAV